MAMFSPGDEVSLHLVDHLRDCRRAIASVYSGRGVLFPSAARATMSSLNLVACNIDNGIALV